MISSTEGNMGGWTAGKSITKMHYYIFFEQVAMYTPQKFQNFYMAPNLRLTPRAKAGSMLYAAVDGMTTVEELDLGGAYFEGQFGGPYPELIRSSRHLTADRKERLYIINCSNNTYSNLDMSTLIGQEGLYLYQRHNSTPWASEKADEFIDPFDKTDVTLRPYSVTFIGEKEIIDGLIDYDFHRQESHGNLS